MASQASITLPLHARSQDVLAVLARLLGEPTEPCSLGEIGSRSRFLGSVAPRPVRAIDPSTPSSESNPWYIPFPDFAKYRFEPGPVNSQGADPSSVRLVGEGPADMHLVFLLHLENEAGACRSMIPPSTALMVAVGTAFVRFFGGTILANDDLSAHAKPMVVPDSAALFPAARPEQGANDRFYQFQNALFQLRPLSANDLRVGARRSAEGITPRVKSLLAFLRARDAALSLDEALPTHSSSPKLRL